MLIHVKWLFSNRLIEPEELPEPQVLRRQPEPQVLRRQPELLRRQPEPLRRQPELPRHQPELLPGQPEPSLRRRREPYLLQLA